MYIKLVEKVGGMRVTKSDHTHHHADVCTSSSPSSSFQEHATATANLPTPFSAPQPVVEGGQAKQKAPKSPSKNNQATHEKPHAHNVHPVQQPKPGY